MGWVSWLGVIMGGCGGRVEGWPVYGRVGLVYLTGLLDPLGDGREEGVVKGVKLKARLRFGLSLYCCAESLDTWFCWRFDGSGSLSLLVFESIEICYRLRCLTEFTLCFF